MCCFALSRTLGTAKYYSLSKCHSASPPCTCRSRGPALDPPAGGTYAVCGRVIVRHSPDTPWRLRRASWEGRSALLPAGCIPSCSRCLRGEERRPLRSLPTSHGVTMDRGIGVRDCITARWHRHNINRSYAAQSFWARSSLRDRAQNDCAAGWNDLTLGMDPGQLEIQK